MWQKRSLLCTNNRLINLDGYDVKRSIDIIKIKALTKNIKPKIIANDYRGVEMSIF